MISSELIDKDAADHVSGLYFSRQVEFPKAPAVSWMS
jgi:hypothetical protein